MANSKRSTTKSKGKPRGKKAPAPTPEQPAEPVKQDIVLVTDDAVYECRPATDENGLEITGTIAELPRDEVKELVDLSPPEPAPAPIVAPQVLEVAPAEPVKQPEPPQELVPAPVPAGAEPPPKMEPTRKFRLAIICALGATGVLSALLPTPLWVFAGIIALATGMTIIEIRRMRPRTPKVEEQPAKPTFFSQRHPRLHELACRIGPRAHSVALMLVILFASMNELGKRNYDFMYDWYRATPVLPGLVNVLTVPGEWDRFAQDYGMIALLIGIIMAWFIVLFYAMVWRFFFKTYWRVSNRVESPEGRIYWWDGNMWYRLWDRIYKSPPRTSYTFHIKPRWWPLFNPINPTSNLIKLTISASEEVEYRGPWKIWVHERSRRAMSSTREYYTLDGQYSSLKIPVRESAATFITRSREMIQDTHLISLGNPSVRNRQLENCAFPVPSEFKEVIRNARKAEKPEAPQPDPR